MGREPVHDALLRLQAEGLVEPLPRRGFCVTAPTVETMREIYEIVGALEGQAVRRATREGGAILIGALEAAIRDQELALASDDADAWLRADRRFHELLRDAAGNRRLRDLFRLYDGQLQRARIATIHLRPQPRRSTDDHREILAAIRGRDEDEAARIHHRHRRRADAEMLAAVRELATELSGGARPVDGPSRQPSPGVTGVTPRR
jgi:DNA-binding GntR family transcriptional regulator